MSTAASSTGSARPPAPQASATPAGRSRGPIAALASVVIGLAFSTLSSWIFGTALTILGDHTFWKGRGVERAIAAVEEDFGYLQGYPRSLMVDDTVAFARDFAELVARPFHSLGAPAFIARTTAIEPDAVANPHARAVRRIVKEVGRAVETAYYVAQDTAIRLAIAFYALPAFAMAIFIGLIDGLVRRDLRRWTGGRESSYVYHHSKRFTWWFLTAGFTAYLAWPFGGFNPAYLVLIFATLVAAALSTTASTFKKYL